MTLTDALDCPVARLAALARGHGNALRAADATIYRDPSDALTARARTTSAEWLAAAQRAAETEVATSAAGAMFQLRIASALVDDFQEDDLEALRRLLAGVRDFMERAFPECAGDASAADLFQ